MSCDPLCDWYDGADVVTDGTNPHAAIDFVLLTSPAIQGNVTDDLGAPRAGVWVRAYNTLGVNVGSATTNALGDYTIANLWARDFYVRTDNNLGYVDGLYSGEYCHDGCDPRIDGTPVTLIAGTTQTGIDLQMGSAANISGTVMYEAAPVPVQGVTMELYLTNGTFVGSTVTDGAGEYELDGLTAGEYHLVTRNFEGLINEGAAGDICHAPCSPTTTAVVSVATNESVVLDYVLDYGTSIAGTVTAGPFPSITVAAFNTSGTQVRSTVTKADGTYNINGLENGSYYLRTFNAAPYRNQLYNGLPCDGSCNVLDGTEIPVTQGAPATGKDFELESGYSISGVVTDDVGAGLGGIYVTAFDSEGAQAGTSMSIAGGEFVISGLSSGDYKLRTNNFGIHIDEVYGGDTCTPEPCGLDPATVIPVTTTDVAGIVIELEPGSPITGIVTDGFGQPLPSGTAWLYSTSGQYLESAAINADGYFGFNGIADGEYRALIRNESGLVDQLYDGVECPEGSCNVLSGTPIYVGIAPPAGAAATGAFAPAAAGEGAHLQVMLGDGYHIGGSVLTETAQPVSFTKVYFFDIDGNPAGSAMTDGLGNFTSPGSFPAGTYYAATSRAARPEDSPAEALDAENGVGLGLVDEAWDGFPCTGICAPSDPSEGTPIDIVAADVTDVHFVLDYAPGIDLEKLTLGVDADTPNGGQAPEIAPGDTVSWSYVVTNTGSVELTGIAVTDDQLGEVQCPLATLPPGEFTVCIVMGVADDLSDEPFDGVIGNCNGRPGSRLYQNTGTVTASAAAQTVEDQDSSHYCNPLKNLMFKDGFE
jgi:hypothetical protein